MERREVKREVFGPGGRRESWFVRAASLISFACRRREYFGGAQQPDVGDFVGSNSEVTGVVEVEGVEEEEEESMNRSRTVP